MSFRWKAASLEGKLTVLVAAVVVSVVGAITYLDNRFTVHAVEQDLLEVSSGTADSIASQLGVGTWESAALSRLLLEHLRSHHQILEIDVFSATAEGGRLVGTTSAGEPRQLSPEDVAAVRAGKNVARRVEQQGTRLWSVVWPVESDGKLSGWVSVWCSLQSADVIAQQNRRRALVVVPLSIALLVALLRWVFIRMVHRPLRELEHAMLRAEGGDLKSEAPVVRPDEIGVIAARYNDMLGRIRGFHEELSWQVEQATEELHRKNRELRRLNEELYYLQRRLTRIERLTVAEQLAASFAHKVGTPLNLVSGHIQMLLQARPEDPALQEKLRLVYSQIEKIAAIVKGMLDETRKPVLKLEPVNLNRLLERIFTLVDPTLALRSVKVNMKLGSRLPTVSGDEAQLEQVFLTLLNNSLDAMPQGGDLEVATEGVEGKVRVRFIDSGEGIPESAQSQLFRPFFTTKEIGQGTGLGLAIVKEILSAHGATIRAESEPGRGARFIMEFPAVGVSEKAAAS
jgi:two-component system NtrC family sensor kinase